MVEESIVIDNRECAEGCDPVCGQQFSHSTYEEPSLSWKKPIVLHLKCRRQLAKPLPAVKLENMRHLMVVRDLSSYQD